MIEKDPTWSVYGVGIIQQANVVRAMAELGPDRRLSRRGRRVRCRSRSIFPTARRWRACRRPGWSSGYPANVGIGRRALHKVLGDTRQGGRRRNPAGRDGRSAGRRRRGRDRRASPTAPTGGSTVVVGADGVYSQTRETVLPDAPEPEFTGQSGVALQLRRARPTSMRCRSTTGRPASGWCRISETLMYMYVTTPEPGNPRYPREGLAAAMRAKLVGDCRPLIRALAEQIIDDDEVVYRPLEALFLDGPWHKGRVVLLGDAVHATTPHLGQGAGMAIEDAIVLAEELARHDDPEAAFAAYRERRFERCRYIVEQSAWRSAGASWALRPPVDNAKATARDVRASPPNPSERPEDIMSRVTEIRYVGYGVADFDAERAVLRRGLGPGRGRRARTAWPGSRPTGHDEHHVVRLRQVDSQPRRRDRARRRHPRRRRCPARQGRRGRAARSSIAPRDLDAPGGGYGFRFFSPDGLPFEMSSDVARGDSRAMTRWEGGAGQDQPHRPAFARSSRRW